MSRNLERSTARANYAKFAKKWRQEKRLAGVYGQPGYRRPSFSEWYSLQDKKREKPPEHAYLEIGADDPWLENPALKPQPDKTEERGVTTINIAGSEDE